MSSVEEKYQDLRSIIASYGKLAVAFSGGVDSTLLLAVAHDVLGSNALAVTVTASFVPDREVAEAKQFCQERGITHALHSIAVLDNVEICHNPPNRCYLCKTEVFSGIISVAHSCGIDIVADGSNVDDQGDYRPGHVALRELGVESPLLKANLTKADIRAISKQLGLPTWNKQSYACLATRFPYGELITQEKLTMVDDAEQALMDEGFTQLRVRMHGDVARIEVPQVDIERFMDPVLRARIDARFKEIGFTFVALDLAGYRSGSMNDTISE